MGILTEIRGMLQVAVLAGIVVFIAMIIDLIAGVHKAKLRNERRRSYLLSRTLYKFIQYEGGMMIAVGMDLLIHFAHIKQLFGLETIKDVPIVTLLVGVFLLGVEWLSLREKADEKMDKDFKKTWAELSKILSKKELQDLLLKRLKDAEAEVKEEIKSDE